MGSLLDLVLIWTAIIAVGVFLYVLLDGFDLGVGILYGFAPEAERSQLINSIAPVWDGNETWLILGGVALLAVFPVAFAIIIPAVYFPVLLMLLALVFRGSRSSSGSNTRGYSVSGPGGFAPGPAWPLSRKERSWERSSKALPSRGESLPARHGTG